MSASPSMQAQADQLRESGYVVLPGFVPPAPLAELALAGRTQRAVRTPPLELEADLRYPGAPLSPAQAGGDTVRRLLDAYGREPSFARCAVGPRLRQWLEAYFGEAVWLSRSHHNCLMTKHPRFGSMTGWHRDIRYWSFEREDLVSVWFALGVETAENGGLWFVPGSHRMTFAPDCFDAAKFFRSDRADNAALLRSAESPHLSPGDVVLFHCKTLHSAGTNRSAEVKYSLVYTYHGAGNRPLPGTRSTSLAEVELR